MTGVVFWSSLLLRPPTVFHAPQPAAPDLMDVSSSSAMLWFSNTPTTVNIKIFGVMASTHGAVAILSLNDGPPTSYLAGERLSQGIRLLAVEDDGVLIERGKERSRLTINKLADGPMLPTLTR
nr:type II secretion system protein N [Pseudomonas sp. ITA]